MNEFTITEVIKGLAAAEFAAAQPLYLDVLVTLDFGRMRIHDAQGAKFELQRFLKAADAWLRERNLPVLWLAAIERDRLGGFHAHIAIHIPPMLKTDGKLYGRRHRTHFRRWAREAVARRTGEYIPKAVNVRCTLTQSIVAHWVCVTYLLKGYDRSAVLAHARVAPSGVELTLGDILPFPYHPPGDVGLDKRLFVSGGLGPAQRAMGVPKCGIYQLERVPDIMSIDVSGVSAPPPLDGWKVPRVPRPFRAWVEDGVFDVRLIYGAEFAAFVTGVLPEGDKVVDAEAFDWEEHLQSLGI